MVNIISIIIPTCNRKNILKKCLGALFDQEYPKEKYEIIVVDDGATDGTGVLVRELIMDSPCQLRYFKQVNKGPAAARNVGVKNAKGEIILFTGDDCIADYYLLQEHAKYHNKYSEIAVLGYTAWHPYLEVTPFMEYILTSGVQYGYSLIKDKENIEFWFFYTSNISVRKKHLIDVGLFDEDFKYAAYEDTELGYRLQRSSLKIMHSKKALVYHMHPTTMERFCQRQKLSGLSAVLFYKKHPELRESLGIDKAKGLGILEYFEKEYRKLYCTFYKTKTSKLYRCYAKILRYYYLMGIKEGLYGKH
jgi:GT2 family glycosyltransferase